MRVAYHEMISPGASDAVQLDCKKGQIGQTLGETLSLDLENGESDGLASSYVWVRVMSAYEWCVDWSVSMHVCRFRDALHKSACDRALRSHPATAAHGHIWIWESVLQRYCCGGIEVVNLHLYPDRHENVAFSTKLLHWKLHSSLSLSNDWSNRATQCMS